MLSPISPRIPTPSVRVEYDRNGKRATKHFDDAYLARRFYLAKLKAHKNPVVKKGA